MAVNNRGTEAYDLSLFEPKQPKLVALKPNKKVEKAQKRRNRVQAFFNAVLTLSVAAMVVGVLGMMISSRVQLTEMNAQISAKEEELRVLQTEYVRITNELSQKTSAQNVQDYASGTLGMQKMEPYQIEYITVDNSNMDEQPQQTEKGLFGQIGEAIADFFNGLAYLFG